MSVRNIHSVNKHAETARNNYPVLEWYERWQPGETCFVLLRIRSTLLLFQ